MAYLIPIMLVLVLISGVVTFTVLNATKQSKPSDASSSDGGAGHVGSGTDTRPQSERLANADRPQV